jgi:hypothetical protein
VAQGAFFPWLELESDAEVGGFRFLRYDRQKRRPGTTTEEQALFDELLEPYRTTGGANVRGRGRGHGAGVRS